jgi:hypothetical protein
MSITEFYTSRRRSNFCNSNGKCTARNKTQQLRECAFSIYAPYHGCVSKKEDACTCEFAREAAGATEMEATK